MGIVSGGSTRAPGTEQPGSFDDTLHAAGIELCIAEMKDPVKDKLKRFGLFTRLGEKLFFATIGEAVNTYLDTFSVDWVDWQDGRR